MPLFRRFPLMFRCVHERHVASLRFDLESHRIEHNKLVREVIEAESKIESQAANHTRALQALEAAYQKDKAEFERNRILPFATFKAQEVGNA